MYKFYVSHLFSVSVTSCFPIEKSITYITPSKLSWIFLFLLLTCVTTQEKKNETQSIIFFPFARFTPMNGMCCVHKHGAEWIYGACAFIVINTIFFVDTQGISSELQLSHTSILKWLYWNKFIYSYLLS